MYGNAVLRAQCRSNAAILTSRRASATARPVLKESPINGRSSTRRTRCITNSPGDDSLQAVPVQALSWCRTNRVALDTRSGQQLLRWIGPGGSIALAVVPGAIVNISGVVTGCSCEEGSACSDQVWVVAHRSGYSQGLELSRVNGHWGVGVVQQWWLNFQELQVVRATSPSTYNQALQNLYDSYPACTDKAGATQEILSRMQP